MHVGFSNAGSGKGFKLQPLPQTPTRSDMLAIELVQNIGLVTCGAPPLSPTLVGFEPSSAVSLERLTSGLRVRTNPLARGTLRVG